MAPPSPDRFRYEFCLMWPLGVDVVLVMVIVTSFYSGRWFGICMSVSVSVNGWECRWVWVSGSYVCGWFIINCTIPSRDRNFLSSKQTSGIPHLPTHLIHVPHPCPHSHPHRHPNQSPVRPGFEMTEGGRIHPPHRPAGGCVTTRIPLPY